METTTGCVVGELNALDFRTIPKGSFRIVSPTKKSKTIEFFDDLYTYPPNFRVKWDTIDELHEDLFMSYNYRTLNHSLPFMEVLTDFVPTEKEGSIQKTKYSLNSYLDGYLNKITSTQFYKKQSKRLQQSLQNVPVYAVLNGQNEIILAASTDSTSSNTTNIKKTTYDLCGTFDPLAEQNTQLGLFFMSRDDAEVYLNEIAKSDTQGTKMFGLSIHCFGLDFAYRVTREYHPNIDFRFVPNLNEVQTLLTPQKTGNSNFLFEDDQQQLRFRRRPINIIPVFNKINKWASPLSSFLEKTEYFKGVPIYIVKTTETNKNFFAARYADTVSVLDSISGRLINFIGSGFGFGNNWIMEGSIQSNESTPTTKTYVFFEEKAATEFCHSYKQNISRYKGSRSQLLQPIIKKPKILIHNLEDFLELLEDPITQKNQNINLDVETLQLIPSEEAKRDVDTYIQQNKKSIIQKTTKFFDFKYRRLSGFLEVLFNTN